MAPKIVLCCLSVVRWTPVIFITAVIVWSYYAYVVQMCIFTIENRFEQVIYLLLFHPIIAIFMWAYWKTIFSEPGSVPKQFYLTPDDLRTFDTTEDENVQRGILEKCGNSLHGAVQCRTGSNSFRYCEKCKCIKPDRAHHCSVCGQCVLKMDHHCPWVNNCVNFTNYKFFILFLGYGLVYCMYVAATSAQYFIKFWTLSGNRDMSNLQIIFLFFAAVMFAISLVSLFGYHCYLSCANRSTLESFRAPLFRGGVADKDGFSLGKLGNFQEVFGDNKLKWFLPIFSSKGDGLSYPTRITHSSDINNYHSTEDTGSPPAINSPTPLTPPQTKTPPEETVVNMPQQQASNTSNLPPSTISSTVTANNNSTTGEVPSTNSTNAQSFGDGVSYPVRTLDEDSDRLLGERQRWMEEGEEGNESHGYQNGGLTTKM